MEVKDFLARYRAEGLPGAKKFRRKTRLQEAAATIEIQQSLIARMIKDFAVAKNALAEFAKEGNWFEETVTSEDNNSTPLKTVIWAGEGNPVEIAKQALTGEASGEGQQEPDSKTTDSSPDIREPFLAAPVS